MKRNDVIVDGEKIQIVESVDKDGNVLTVYDIESGVTNVQDIGQFKAYVEFDSLASVFIWIIKSGGGDIAIKETLMDYEFHVKLQPKGPIIPFHMDKRVARFFVRLIESVCEKKNQNDS